MRFVITGSGRCGTKYLSTLLMAAGVPCGHEQVYNADGAGPWPPGLRADSSWMAVPHLPLPHSVVLLVRHPLAVVRSWVEIGFFSSHDAGNPTHGPLRGFAPQVYDEATPADRALSMWLHLNRAALPHAEMVAHLDRAESLRHLLSWTGVRRPAAARALAYTPRINRHTAMKAQVGVRHTPDWAVHRPDLADAARRLAADLDIDPEGVPDG